MPSEYTYSFLPQGVLQYFIPGSSLLIKGDSQELWQEWSLYKYSVDEQGVKQYLKSGSNRLSRGSGHVVLQDPF